MMMDVTWPSDEMFLPLKRDVQMHRINFWDHDAVRQRETIKNNYRDRLT